MRDRVLSEGEEERLFAQAPPYLRLFLAAALHTGLRYREILGLKWKNISFETRLVKVENTKSKKARFIPMNSRLYDTLKVLRAEDGERSGVFGFKDVREGFLNACHRASIEGLTFHDLRRTFGTRLIKRGVDIVTISKLYGHSSVLVTQRYLHPGDTVSREAVELLAEGTRKPVENAENLAPIGHTKKHDFPLSLPNHLFSMN